MAEKIIEVRNLVKTFGQIKAVDNVSFDVEKGDIFAFLGPNGAGKTTTIKMLTTLLTPTGGGIQVNGHDVSRARDAVRKSFGIIFQDPSLDDELTAYENMDFHGVLYGLDRDLRQKRIEELMTFVELWDRRDNLVKTFSGGMKRRLEIARGLLHHPKILFMDEPTLGLDPQTRNHIWTYIEGLNKKEGITVFFTTHYMQEAEKAASKVAVIDHGQVVKQGTVAEIKASAGAATLEDAFIKLTGRTIREEGASSLDALRKQRQMWGGGTRK